MAKQTISIGTVANDGTGDPIRTAFDKTNDNFDELYVSERFGIYDYSNTLSSQSFTGTPIILNNNGAGTDTNLTYKLSAVANIYDTSAYEFDFSGLTLGDAVNIRGTIAVTTTSVNQTIRFELVLSAGYIINFFIGQFKDIGTYVINSSNFIYIGNTDTRDLPATFQFDSSDNATVTVIGWACKVDKRLV